MRKTKFVSGVIALTLSAMTYSSNSYAAEKITFVLNWFPTADHSPYYFAQENGWYSDAGLDVKIETAQGSAAAAQRIGVGQAQMGVADLPTAFIARGKGAEMIAVMAVYANSPQGFYWRKSVSGINSPKDFPGHTIGNPPGDAARAMWPAFAQAVGIPVDSVNFVNVAPQAKMPSLMSNQIDITSDFYNGHDLKLDTIGDDLGFVAWRDVGVNPYGNSIFANSAYLESNEENVAKFIAVTQRAFDACATDHEPCIDALLKNVSGKNRDRQMEQWLRVEELMSTEPTRTIALGYLDPAGLEATYELVNKYFALDNPFEVTAAYTNKYLDNQFKAPGS